MEFTKKEEQMLLWASFLSLMAAGVGFVFRAMVGGLWGADFQITGEQVGQLFGAGLWPIAIMMILFSFIVDKIGYKTSMFVAFALQALSVLFTFTASSFSGMMTACILAGLGHGVVEAVINPLCASVFRTEKTKAMNILHASWPAGIVVGGTIYMGFFMNTNSWAAAKIAWIFMLIPVLAYGVMFLMCKKFPVDERVESNVSMMEMLREFGGMGAFLAITFIFYEIFNQLAGYGVLQVTQIIDLGDYTQLILSFVIGGIGGIIFGSIVKGKGKWMFFFLCLIMIPLATAELATDAWIKELMKPTLGDAAGWALVFSALIMMLLRFSSGIPLKLTGGPLGLLLTSSVFSIIGLFWLSWSSGLVVWIAFIFYAVGQTYYWPSILGFTSERFPKGGAVTLNTVSAMGLLTVGVFGGPFLGVVQDHYNSKAIMENQPALIQTIKAEGRKVEGAEKQIVGNKNFFGVNVTTIDAGAFMAQPEFPAESKPALEEKLSQTGRSTLRVAAWLPISMAIGFILMLLWFRANGGYKPIILGKNNE